MGYALMFARKLHNNAKKNQLNYEISDIQRQKNNITKQLSYIQQSENAMNAMNKMNANGENGGETPSIPFMDGYREMLNLLSNNLDVRMAAAQAQLESIAAEEKSVNDALSSQIQSSTPNYVG